MPPKTTESRCILSQQFSVFTLLQFLSSSRCYQMLSDAITGHKKCCCGLPLARGPHLDNHWFPVNSGGSAPPGISGSGSLRLLAGTNAAGRRSSRSKLRKSVSEQTTWSTDGEPVEPQPALQAFGATCGPKGSAWRRIPSLKHTHTVQTAQTGECVCKFALSTRFKVT